MTSPVTVKRIFQYKYDIYMIYDNMMYDDMI